MPRTHTITATELVNIEAVRAIYSSRYTWEEWKDGRYYIRPRETVCNNKEILAILGAAGSFDDAVILMNERVGLPGWRGQTSMVPYFPELPRK